MSDDSIRIKDTLHLIGHATLATLELLESRGLLAPDSEVKDIALVLGLLIEVIMSWPGHYNEPEFSWVKTVITKAEGKGISIAGAPFGVEESVKKIKESKDKGPRLSKSAWNREVGSRIFISSLGIQIHADH
jgi:hypothetical protein